MQLTIALERYDRHFPFFDGTVKPPKGIELKTMQVGQEQVSFVTSNELYRLPAGNWPALVYINDQPRRNPILVDLDQDLPKG